MNCTNSEMLIMKYLDGDMTEDEAKSLNTHMLACDKCRNSFGFYESLISDFDKLPEACAPEDFEITVMAKIKALDHNYAEVEYRIEHKVLGVVLGTFSVVIGSGVALYTFREPILNSLSHSEYVEPYYDKLLYISDFAGGLAEMCKDTLESFTAAANGTITAYMGVIAALIVLVAALQGYLLYKRRR